MIYATFALAAVATAIAAQGTPPLASGNYSGLERITRPTARHELKQNPPPGGRVHGRVVEMAPYGRAFQPGPCGMPTIAADASIDPKFLVPIPGSHKAVEATSRQVDPPPCGPFSVVPANQPAPVEGIRRDRR